MPRKKSKTISLCMIVKDEEKNIDACLSSIHDIVDEIIIVDTGSTDNTKELCKKYTDKIYDFEWVNDFALARNYSYSKATCDFIMWMDADDVLLEANRKKLLKLKKSLDLNNSVYSMVYDYSFDDNGNVTFSLKLNRLVKNLKDPTYKYWEGFIHEHIITGIDLAVETDVHITHTRKHGSGMRNLEIFEAKLAEGYPFTTRDILYYSRELHVHGFLEMALHNFNVYLGREDKWEEDIIDAFIRMADIYRQMHNTEAERECLYKTFETDVRAEALYPLALTFSREGKFTQSIFFLESILNLSFPKDCLGFLRNDEWNLKPYIELSYCYYHTGNMKKFKEYHLKAKELAPNHPAVLYNEQFVGEES